MKTRLILTLILFAILETVNAQNTIPYDSTKKTPLSAIEDIEWLAGHWRGEAFGGQIDEIWTPPVGNSMMFSFQATANGKVNFYEFGTITEEKGTLILRLKHFHSDLKGWEEKDDRLERQLVKLTESFAYFDNFTFERVSQNELNIYVLFKDEGSAPYEMKFNYKRL